jgi:hypothetical protein
MSHYEQAAAVGVEDSPAELAYAQVHATLAAGAAVDRLTRLLREALEREQAGNDLQEKLGYSRLMRAMKLASEGASIEVLYEQLHAGHPLTGNPDDNPDPWGLSLDEYRRRFAPGRLREALGEAAKDSGQGWQPDIDVLLERLASGERIQG